MRQQNLIIKKIIIIKKKKKKRTGTVNLLLNIFKNAHPVAETLGWREYIFSRQHHSINACDRCPTCSWACTSWHDDDLRGAWTLRSFSVPSSIDSITAVRLTNDAGRGAADAACWFACWRSKYIERKVEQKKRVRNFQWKQQCTACNYKVITNETTKFNKKNNYKKIKR